MENLSGGYRKKIYKILWRYRTCNNFIVLRLELKGLREGGKVKIKLVLIWSARSPLNTTCTSFTVNIMPLKEYFQSFPYMEVVQNSLLLTYSLSNADYLTRNRHERVSLYTNYVKTVFSLIKSHSKNKLNQHI